jgi:hypothetical protein
VPFLFCLAGFTGQTGVGYSVQLKLESCHMCAAIFLALILNVPAVEPWADGGLPSVPGLAAWYSAEVQGKAHAAMGLAEPWTGV